MNFEARLNDMNIKKFTSRGSEHMQAAFFFLSFVETTFSTESLDFTCDIAATSVTIFAENFTWIYKMRVFAITPHGGKGNNGRDGGEEWIAIGSRACHNEHRLTPCAPTVCFGGASGPGRARLRAMRSKHPSRWSPAGSQSAYGSRPRVSARCSELVSKEAKLRNPDVAPPGPAHFLDLCFSIKTRTPGSIRLPCRPTKLLDTGAQPQDCTTAQLHSCKNTKHVRLPV